MAQGLSDRSLSAWYDFAQTFESGADGPLDRDLLNRFIIRVHTSGEELTPHQLKTLVDELDLSSEEAAALIAYIEPALGLLAAYDRATSLDDDDDFEVGPGVLVL
jgi:hypothetical protein